jgi:hypothetical protein
MQYAWEDEYTPYTMGTRVRHCQLMTLAVTSTLDVTIYRFCFQYTFCIHMPVGNANILPQGFCSVKFPNMARHTLVNSVDLVRKRTIPTERPQPAGHTLVCTVNIILNLQYSENGSPLHHTCKLSHHLCRNQSELFYKGRF